MRFEVKAYRDPEGFVAVLLDANNEDEAALEARSQGYKILAIKQATSWRGISFHRRRGFPLVLFSQQLLALLDAGLPLVESIETLAENEAQEDTKTVLGQMVKQLYEGQSVSHAMQQFPSVFPPLYIATVRASERTGDLKEALMRYVAYENQLDIVRKKLVSASIYPAVLIGVGALVTLFLMGYVVPKFSRIYEDIGGNLPLMSQLLMQWGSLLERHGIWVLSGFILILVAIIYAAMRPQTRRWIGHKLWKVPSLGYRMRIYQLARFYRTLGMLLRGGTPIVTALDMVSGLLHPTLKPLLHQATRDIREGQSISEAMTHHGLVTPVAVRMLRVGEHTGSMGEMMERIAAFYDEDMARWVDWFTKLFEPLLMAFIGVIIGAIVLLMYMPIFELAGGIQ